MSFHLIINTKRCTTLVYTHLLYEDGEARLTIRASDAVLMRD
jgi:hypothetical protein